MRPPTTQSVDDDGDESRQVGLSFHTPQWGQQMVRVHGCLLQLVLVLDHVNDHDHGHTGGYTAEVGEDWKTGLWGVNRDLDPPCDAGDAMDEVENVGKGVKPPPPPPWYAVGPGE